MKDRKEPMRPTRPQTDQSATVMKLDRNAAGGRAFFYLYDVRNKIMQAQGRCSLRCGCCCWQWMAPQLRTLCSLALCLRCII